MRPQTTPPKIIQTLLLDRGLNKYQLGKKLHLSYSRIHESIDMLEKKGWVAAEKVEKSRAGLDIKNYRLTPEGVLAALATLENETKLDFLLQKRDQIAANYADLFPLFFGKWEHFKKYNVDEALFSMFSLAAQGFYLEFETPHQGMKIINMSFDPDQFFIDSILNETIDSGFRVKSKLTIFFKFLDEMENLRFKSINVDVKQIFTAFKSDPELKKALLTELEERKRKAAALDQLKKFLTEEKHEL